MIIKFFVITYISTVPMMQVKEPPMFYNGARLLSQEQCEEGIEVINKYLRNKAYDGMGIRKAICLPAELGSE